MPTLESIVRMKPGDHYCGIYQTDDEHRQIAVEFIRQGLERGEKILYVVSAHAAAELREMLHAAGIDADGAIHKGQLIILSAKDAYLKEGVFDPDAMIALLRGETEQALADGYAALRVTGEMTWALAGEPGSERLIEYESKLNRFFPGSRCYAVCQYDRRRFDAEALLDVLHTHPKVLLGIEALDNSRVYYVPPDGFLGADRQGAILDQWLENLSAHGFPVD